jgi:hypothetical protein
MLPVDTAGTGKSGLPLSAMGGTGGAQGTVRLIRNIQAVATNFLSVDFAELVNEKLFHPHFFVVRQLVQQKQNAIIGVFDSIEFVEYLCNHDERTPNRTD